MKPEWRKLFGVPDECKPRDGGTFILMNDSSGGFAGLDVTETFTSVRDVRNVKSFSPSPDGDLMTVPRESWWTDTLLVYPHGSSDASAIREITLPGAKFYKARWM